MKDIEEKERRLLALSPFVKEAQLTLKDGFPHAKLYPDFQALQSAHIVNIESQLRWYCIELYNMEVDEEEKIRSYAISLHPLQEAPSTKAEEVPDDALYKSLEVFLFSMCKCEIHPSSHLELDLRLDSLNYVELFLFVEQSFGVEMNEVIFSEIMVMQDFYLYVKAHKKSFHPTEMDWIKMLSEDMDEKLIYILLIAAIVSFVIKKVSDGSFILGALLVNAFIGTHQEYRAGERADALKKIIKSYVTVIRDAKRVELPSEEITRGDILYFESGVKVPADIRLIDTHDLFVNESLLTGESIDIHKDAEYISKSLQEPIGDRKNMLYAGSLVTKGRGLGVVTAIGTQTEVGKIASLLATEETQKAPLMLRMERFSLNISKIIAVVVLFIIALGIYQEMPFKDIFFLTVALAVSAIPEGLPVAITVALSVASASMSKRNVIVRKLSAIEGLGSCTLIASDKTGTMTQNRLSVEHFITLQDGSASHDSLDAYVALSAILCNEVSMHKEEGEVVFMGDQVDIALARYALEIDRTLFERDKRGELIDKMPYEAVNKYSAMSYKLDEKKVHFIKGSPEIVLKKCALSEVESQKILKQVDEWADKGFRTIALAYKVSQEEEIAKEGYTYLGFAAITDPLREGVAEAVKTAEAAGIEVVMITGDHPNTAYFIAKALEIAISKDEVMDGVDILRWQEEGAHKEEIADKRVFARVSPEQKQLIVKTFQKLGHFVAVTGDGANDAPALKFANIGIAMGKSGTDVARESSDLILTDDSFDSIVNGIEEGRVAYDNIRKVIHLLISTGFGEIILVLLSLLFFIPIPLLPIQLLWLNLVANGIQDVALGLEGAEPGVLQRKPRDPKEPIFNSIMISRVVVSGLYMGLTSFALFFTMLQFGYEVESARNITLLLMVLLVNVQAFNSRSENNPIFKINHLYTKTLLNKQKKLDIV